MTHDLQALWWHSILLKLVSHSADQEISCNGIWIFITVITKAYIWVLLYTSWISSPTLSRSSRSILMLCFNESVIYSQEILLQIRLYQELGYQVEHPHDQLPASCQCVQAQSVLHQLSTTPDACCRAPVPHVSIHGQVQLRLLHLGWALPWKHRLWGLSRPPIVQKIQPTFHSCPNCTETHLRLG